MAKKTSFNKNLYNRNQQEKKQENPKSDRMAYYVYVVCCVLFAISMIISFSNQDYTRGAIYMVLTFLALFLIQVYHRKSGKK